MRRSWVLGIGLAIGCGDGGKDSDSGTAAHMLPITVSFRGAVGAEDFSCAGPLSGLGSSGSTWTPEDFRLYVHDLVLLDDEGGRFPVTLHDDGKWQNGRVALLDFEDHTGGCLNGTDDTNGLVLGDAPHGTYSGLSFSVGVPFELNHNDAAAAPSPLNLSTMFWSWQGGYKFLRLDGASTGQPDGALVHLGSTGCEADAYGVVSGCSEENVATITLDGFDPTQSTVVVDLAGLFEAVDLDQNVDGTASLCMSDQSDPDCAGVFAALGLAFDGRPADPAGQTFFRVE